MEESTSQNNQSVARWTSAVTVILSSAVLMAGVAHAQNPPGMPAGCPNKPIKFVVGSVAGGGADFLARLAATKLSEKWGHQWIVENISSGVGGVVALEQTSGDPNDGYNFQNHSGCAQRFAPIWRTPEVQAILLKSGSDPVDALLEEFKQEIADRMNSAEKLIKETGLQLQ